MRVICVTLHEGDTRVMRASDHVLAGALSGTQARLS